MVKLKRLHQNENGTTSPSIAMRVALKEAEAARKARHTHVVAMIKNTVPMKAKPATRVMMATAAIVDEADNTQVDSSESSSEEEDAEACDAQMVERQVVVNRHVDLVVEFDEAAHSARVKPTARIQVFRAGAAPPQQPQQGCILEIEEEADDEPKEEPNSFLQLFAELKSDVSDKFRDQFGFYLHRNLMADLQELDCLQDMAMIAKAEITRIGRNYRDVVFAVAHDLLVLRGLDVHTAASIVSRVFINFHLL